MKNKKTEIRGGALNILGDIYDAHMRGCKKAIDEDPELVILYDLESGFPYVATKVQQQALIDLWENVIPREYFFKPTGKMIMFGAGGDIDNKDYFKNFYGE